MALPIALIVMIATGFDVAGLGPLRSIARRGHARLQLSAPARGGRGGIRNATSNLLVIIAALGVGTAASFVVVRPGTGAVLRYRERRLRRGHHLRLRQRRTVLRGSGRELRAAARSPCVTGSDGSPRIAIASCRIANARCHFTDSVTYGPPSAPMQFSATYTCPALTDQIGAPGEQEVQLTQCGGGWPAAPRRRSFPMNEFQPFRHSDARPRLMQRWPTIARHGRSTLRPAGRLRARGSDDSDPARRSTTSRQERATS